MENKEVKKRGRGRPQILTDKERTNNKTKYMLNKEWYCDICHYDHKLAGKYCHLKTQKHKDNVKKNIMKKIVAITHNK